MGSVLKSIINILIFIILCSLAVRLLGWAIQVLLPIAIIIIAAYIVYMFVNKDKV